MLSNHIISTSTTHAHTCDIYFIEILSAFFNPAPKNNLVIVPIYQYNCSLAYSKILRRNAQLGIVAYYRSYQLVDGCNLLKMMNISNFIPQGNIQ